MYARGIVLDPSVRRVVVDTARGQFAALTCAPPQGSHRHAFFLPGFTGSKEDFGPLLPLVAASGWVATAYDQRGQYETPAAPTDDLSLRGLAIDAGAVASAVCGDDATTERHLVGHSFGGLVAATSAIENPHAWSSVTLMCSGPVGFGGTPHEQLSGLIARIESMDDLESIYQSSADAGPGSGTPRDAEMTPDVEQFLHTRFVRSSLGALRAFGRHLRQTPDMTARLETSGIPIAVMRGAHDDIWRHNVQDTLAARLGTSVIEIADAAHSPAFENPGETCNALVGHWGAAQRRAASGRG